MNHLGIRTVIAGIFAIAALIFSLGGVYEIKNVGGHIVRLNRVTGAVSLCLYQKCLPMPDGQWSDLKPKIPRTIPNPPVEESTTGSGNLLQAIQVDQAMNGL